MENKLLEKLTIEEILNTYTHYAAINILVSNDEVDLPKLPQEVREWSNPLEDEMMSIRDYLKDKTSEIEKFLNINLLERYKTGWDLIELSADFNYEMTSHMFDRIMNYAMSVENTDALAIELIAFYKVESTKKREEMLMFNSKQPKIFKGVSALLYELGRHLKCKVAYYEKHK